MRERTIHVVVRFGWTDTTGYTDVVERAFTDVDAAVRFALADPARHVVSVPLEALEAEDGS